MKKKTVTIGFSILTAVVCGVSLFANISLADVGGDFTIYPSYAHDGNRNWIITSAAPGSTVDESLVLENLSDRHQEINLLVRTASAKNGQFIAETSAPTDGAGTWITTDGDSYSLDPFQKITVPLEITVPRDAAQKQYTAAVFASKKDPAGQSLNIVTQIGVRVYLNVTPDAYLYTNVFTAPGYKNAFFLVISSLGLSGSILYYVISRKEDTAKETISYEKTGV